MSRSRLRFTATSQLESWGSPKCNLNITAARLDWSRYMVEYTVYWEVKGVLRVPDVI